MKADNDKKEHEIQRLLIEIMLLEEDNDAKKID